MSITINSRSVADARVQGVTLRQVLGSYELVFSMYLTIHADPNANHRALIDGARVSVRFAGGQHYDLGFARSEVRFEFTTQKSPNIKTPDLMLPLHPGQLGAIERLRGTGDLEFTLQMKGTGTDSNGTIPIHDDWRCLVPRSDWIKKLRSAHARDVLLLEVPLPILKSKGWSEVSNALQRAESYYRDGDYHGCVSTCRTVVQDLGHKRYKKEDWATPIFRRLESNRTGMSKSEREEAVWATVRHYTHQAHHSGSEGGESCYSREDAQFILTLTASLVAHASSN